jgi:two-component system phosphate regulon response regulator PhoB
MDTGDSEGLAKGQVVVVEDEEDLARVLAFNLEQQGYAVVVCSTGQEALRRARALKPDLITLDLRLPDMSGLDVLQQLKDVPDTAASSVVILSALGDEDTVVTGLNLGAEDYVTKPFRTAELMARIAGVFRRRGVTATTAARLQTADLTMDLETRGVTVAGEEISLTRSEFDLLAHFVGHPNRVFTRQQLCHQALGAGDTVQERTIDAHVRTIRRKLGHAGSYLVTVWGIGYKFNPPDTEG